MTGKTVEQLNDENAELSDRVGKLLKEAAKYRVSRNSVLRENAALRTIAKAHSVNVDEVVSETTLESLTIENGQVTGDFDYKAPSLKQSKTQTKQVKPEESPTSLTEEAIAKMSS